jgi:hypothetical protein
MRAWRFMLIKTEVLMKFSPKLIPFALLLFSISSYASAFSHLLPSSSQKLDTATAMNELRKEFSDSGILLNMDTPLLTGKTPDGVRCSVDLTQLAQMPNQADIATVNLTVAGSADGWTLAREVTFVLSPKFSEQDSGSQNVRKIKSAENVLSLTETEQHTEIVAQLLLGGGETERQVSWTRSIEVTIDNSDKVTSVEISDKNEPSGEAICLLN